MVGDDTDVEEGRGADTKQTNKSMRHFDLWRNRLDVYEVDAIQPAAHRMSLFGGA